MDDLNYQERKKRVQCTAAASCEHSAFLVPKRTLSWEGSRIVQAFINQCEVNHLQRHHLLIVRCLCLRASALRSQNMLTPANATAKTTFQDCMQLLRKARQIAESLAAQSGEKI